MVSPPRTYREEAEFYRLHLVPRVGVPSLDPGRYLLHTEHDGARPRIRKHRFVTSTISRIGFHGAQIAYL